MWFSVFPSEPNPLASTEPGCLFHSVKKNDTPTVASTLRTTDPHDTIALKGIDLHFNWEMGTICYMYGDRWAYKNTKRWSPWRRQQGSGGMEWTCVCVRSRAGTIQSLSSVLIISSLKTGSWRTWNQKSSLWRSGQDVNRQEKEGYQGKC